jgi:molecular chaperone GrpE (heat shock protein)
MARGWESKAVESQIESREASQSSKRKERLTPHQLERLRIRESLQLSRTRVLHDIEEARNPRYQQVLRESLAFLDAKLEALALDDPGAPRVE